MVACAVPLLQKVLLDSTGRDWFLEWLGLVFHLSSFPHTEHLRC